MRGYRYQAEAILAIFVRVDSNVCEEPVFPELDVGIRFNIARQVHQISQNDPKDQSPAKDLPVHGQFVCS